MKKISLILVTLVTLVSCRKDETLEQRRDRTQGDLTYTIQMDSLKELWGTDTVKFNFTTNPEIHSKWMFDMWVGDVSGNTYAGGQTSEMGTYGVRYTPLDPRDPNGERVLRPFTWYMEQGSDKIIANIGGNRAEITIMASQVLIHQIANPERFGEVERWYYGRQVTNGLNMNGFGAKRPG
jgi:hypothetical protein